MVRWLILSPVVFAIVLIGRTLGLIAPEPHEVRTIGGPRGCIQLEPQSAEPPRNIKGSALSPCPSQHTTGFHRDGFCDAGAEDPGAHVVCAQVTDEFLAFTRARGNDLSTARGSFPGLRSGDGWCLCAARWREALEAGVAPPVVLEATSTRALDYVGKATLEDHAASR